jgi:TPR repeat protein
MTIYEIVFKGTKDMFSDQKHMYISACAAIMLFAAAGFSQTQEDKKPQAFRSTVPTSIPLVLPSTLDLQLLEAFVLMQKANAGESPAQHEVGLRYLLGRGFPADTERAAFWIKKAADQKLPFAEYNMGILFMNGMGVEWNPFEAFNYFSASADQEIPEALYVIGLQYTEDLVVPRSWPNAYRYIKKSSELGFEAAKTAKKEMERRGLNKFDTTSIVGPGKEKQNKNPSRSAQKDTSFNLMFIDFHTDTISTIEDTTLIHEVYQATELFPSEASENKRQTAQLDSSTYSILSSSAAAGCPEALCLIGRCYERGIKFQKDLILAGVYYLRALHLDSYRAPALLWKLMNTQNFEHELELQSSRNNPDAFYVWSGLTSIGFTKLLNDKQAFDLLERAALAGHAPSMVELGLCYFTGRWIQKDQNKAVELWNRASELGSIDADVRIAAANLSGQIRTEELGTAISLLRKTAAEGSLFSSLTLAYCYENGIGLSKNKGEAYRLFHRSLVRGSETAFRSLRSMHDEIRPADSRFQLSD